MRSRYAAFALGLGDYLVDTLTTAHDDRGSHRKAMVHQLSRAKDRQKFTGLTIVVATEDEVLFFARIFERGINRSFMELSNFLHEDGGWKYLSGVALPFNRLPENPALLDRAAFLQLV